MDDVSEPVMSREVRGRVNVVDFIQSFPLVLFFLFYRENSPFFSHKDEMAPSPRFSFFTLLEWESPGSFPLLLDNKKAPLQSIRNHTILLTKEFPVMMPASLFFDQPFLLSPES